MKLIDKLRSLASDEPKLERPALVVQGGGLRGVYSIAALSVLEEEGLHDAFSVVVGSSAGAINGAYFLAGQAVEGVGIYVDDLSNRHFVNPLRLHRIVDIDYLVDPVLKQKHPLDIHRLVASRTPLLTVLTDAVTAKPVIVSSHEPNYDAYEVIRATAALPGLYDKIVSVSGAGYVDGGVADAIPVEAAFSTGAKDALVVVTRMAGYRRRGHGNLYKIAGRAMARGQSKAVKSLIGVSDANFDRTMTLLESESNTSPRRTWTAFPSDRDLLVKRTSSDRAELQACAEMAKRDMRTLLYNSTYGD